MNLINYFLPLTLQYHRSRDLVDPQSERISLQDDLSFLYVSWQSNSAMQIQISQFKTEKINFK